MKHSTNFKFSAKVWIYPGMKGAWHFLSVPKKESAQIKKIFGALAGGWGSLPVDATIGKTNWKTSIFPDKKSATYILPLKSEVRKKEKIAEGDTAPCIIKIRV